jgi:23S rRNA (cytosine1962-C5)-methyltransferase
MDARTLYLRKHEDRRLRAGHPWVYSNEVDVARSPLTAFEPGEAVEVRGSDGRSLGMAYVNPASLISARLYSRRAGAPFDGALVRRRLERALALRDLMYPRPEYRLVFGESDALPGLVVDRFGGLLVVQMGTAGVERIRDDVLAVLQGVLRPEAVVLRNDLPSRGLEGLPEAVETVLGEPTQRWGIEEHGARFWVSPLRGQKTGWFWDQRPNRARLGTYVRGRRVLDLYSYAGAWAVQAARAGAAEVLCIDASAEALEQLVANAALNGVEDRVRAVRGDAFERLRELRDAGERFDVVVVDPPAFIKRRKDYESGLEAYRRVNELAVRVLGADGILLSSSCSYRLSRETLVELLYGIARHHDRALQILEHGHQGPDHPIHPAMPETAYLKCVVARLSRET